MKKPRHMTYSNITSTLCLFLVLTTGGAYAKATLIDGKQIRNRTVTGVKIAPNSITSAHIRNGTLTQADMSTGTGKPVGATPKPPAEEHVVGQPCRVTMKGPLEGQIGVWEKHFSGAVIMCHLPDGNIVQNGAVNA